MDAILIYLFGGITLGGLLLFGIIWIIAALWRLLSKVDEGDGKR